MISSMIRTRSFAEILDDLVSDGDEGTDAASRGRSVSGASESGWWHSQFATNAETVLSPDIGSVADFYAEQVEESDEPIVEMTDEDRIVVELDLASAATLADLAQARRAFALHNHPDRFHPALRAKANGRMQLANMLIDRRRREIEAGR
jgi:hypothetical protein